MLSGSALTQEEKEQLLAQEQANSSAAISASRHATSLPSKSTTAADHVPSTRSSTRPRRLSMSVAAASGLEEEQQQALFLMTEKARINYAAMAAGKSALKHRASAPTVAVPSMDTELVHASPEVSEPLLINLASLSEADRQHQLSSSIGALENGPFVDTDSPYYVDLDRCVRPAGLGSRKEVVFVAHLYANENNHPSFWRTGIAVPRNEQDETMPQLPDEDHFVVKLFGDDHH